MRNHIQTSETIDSQIGPLLPSKLKAVNAKISNTKNPNLDVQDCMVQENRSDHCDSEIRTKKKVEKVTKEKVNGRNATAGKIFRLHRFALLSC